MSLRDLLPGGKTSDEVQQQYNTEWSLKLNEGLAKSSSKIVAGIGDILTKKKLDDAALAELEDLLISADLGTATAGKLTQALAKNRFGRDITPEEVREFFAADIRRILEPVARAAGHRPRP